MNGKRLKKNNQVTSRDFIYNVLKNLSDNIKMKISLKLKTIKIEAHKDNI